MRSGKLDPLEIEHNSSTGRYSPEWKSVFVQEFSPSSHEFRVVCGENAVTIVVELRDPTLQYQFMKSSL